MIKTEEDRIVGIIAVFIFSCIAVVGLYLLQFSSGSIPGWLMLAAGMVLFVEAIRFTDRAYLHCPDKRARITLLLALSGVLIVLLASGLDLEFNKLTPIRMALAVFGILWGFSGAYLLIKRDIVF